MSKAPVLRRLWIYQSERFPVFQHGLLIAVFACACVTVTAQIGGRAWPPILAYLVAFVVIFLFFLLLRVADEHKDAEIDRTYRPERPVPRGLVSLRTLRLVAFAAMALQGVVAGVFDIRLLAVLLLVWVWMGLMTAEFFTPAALKARPVLYLISHMIVMPLIVLFAAACEILPREAPWTPGLLPLLALSLANGCVLEIGRKTWSPESEREGVESYSALWGHRRAAIVWLGCVVIAAALTFWVGLIAGAIPPVLAVLALPVVLCLLAARSFMHSPTKAQQKRFDTASGLWVLASYLIIGLAPPATGWL